MDIQRVDFPSHLLEHNLSDQELANIPADKQPVAKDWNRLRRQNEWMMDQIVINRNIVIDMEILRQKEMKEINEQLEFWKRVRWLIGSAMAIVTFFVSMLKMMGYFK